MNSVKNTARMTGVFYLAIFFANIMIAPAIIAELSFTLWLLIKGVRAPGLESCKAIAAA